MKRPCPACSAVADLRALQSAPPWPEGGDHGRVIVLGRTGRGSATGFRCSLTEIAVDGARRLRLRSASPNGSEEPRYACSRKPPYFHPDELASALGPPARPTRSAPRATFSRSRKRRSDESFDLGAWCGEAQARLSDDTLNLVLGVSRNRRLAKGTRAEGGKLGATHE